MYEKAEIKGRQSLLRDRANLIADYEALDHIHFWNPEPEPKYIYYFGQSKNFEEWYETRKDNKGAIYKDFEEKSTFTRRISIEKYYYKYDEFSILQYEDNIKSEIDKINITKDDLKDEVENLSKKLNDPKNKKIKNDNKINKKIEEMNVEIKKIEIK